MIWTKKKLLKHLFYTLYLIIAVALITEITLRYLYTPIAVKLRIEANSLARDPEQAQESLFDYNKMRFIPKSSGKILHQEYNTIANHDNFGFRNPCFDITKKANEIIIGDSFVYGIGVEDKDTLSCQLKNENPQMNIYTMGVPGAGPKEYLLLLEKNKENISKLIEGKTIVSIMIFTGNDFESLLNLGIPILENKNQKQYPFKPIIKAINFHLVKSKWLSESYFLQSIKILCMSLIKPNKTKNYFTNYASSTFYKSSSKSNIEQISSSLNMIKKTIEYNGMMLGKIYLVPDPAEISSSRLARDATLGQFNADQINVQYKFNSILSVCHQQNYSCLDLRESLSDRDYFYQDNHLRPIGVKKISRKINYSY
jgi:hypothetical protein